MNQCTVYKLKGADFSGKGLPSVFSFIAMESLDYAFDLTQGNLKDMTGRTNDLVPYRTSSVSGNAGVHVIDPSILSSSIDGVLITGGCLVTSEPFKQLPVEKGEVAFTRMFVGRWSGGTIPTVGGSPQIATFLDMGNSVSPDGGPMLSLTRSDQSVGVRVGTGSLSANIGGAVQDDRQLFFLIVTYDGNTWTLLNKTTNQEFIKTNSEIGRDTPYIPGTANTPRFHYIGHGHRGSTLAGLPVVASMFASWNKVLSSDEIEKQYQLIKSILNDLV